MKYFSEQPGHLGGECETCGTVLKLYRNHLTENENGYTLTPLLYASAALPTPPFSVRKTKTKLI